MDFRNWRIGARLAAGYALVLAMMLMLIIVALGGFDTIGTSTRRMIDEDWVKADAANTINATTRANARRNMELFISQDAGQRQTVYRHIDANKKIISDALNTLERLVRLPEGKALLANVKSERAQYVASFSSVGKRIEEGNVEEARRLMMEETLPLLDRLQVSVMKLADLQKRIATESALEVQQKIAASTTLIVALGIGALLAAMVLAWLITRSITRPITRAVNLARTVAAGDLTSIIRTRSTDETGQLLEALQEMNASLSVVVTEVRSGTETVSSASAQIAAGNMDLSSRTEDQASSLEETAAAIEELTSAVGHNADNALQANQLASSASAVAERGGAVMAEVVKTMDSINQSARKIADIISVIDGIAFQTNILALNAAVEAARAGEQGRGFAVVASEVRMLAQRSAAAAKEIKTLIGDSVNRADAGSRLVEQAGGTMDEIVVSVRRVSDIMGEIATASHEQTVGIGQVNQAICEMDQVTQRNAELVEESAVAAASLSDRALSLARAVAVFKLPASQHKDQATTLQPRQNSGAGGMVIALHRDAKAKATATPRVSAPARYQRVANAWEGTGTEEEAL